MRLEPLRKVDLEVEQRELYEALVGTAVGRDESFVLDEHGAVKGPFAVLLRHPACGRPMQEMARVLRFAGLLPDAAREAVILVVAAHWDEPHEWERHEALGRDAGLSDAQIDGLRRGDDTSFDDPVTQAAFDAAFAIVRIGDLDDATYGRVQGVLGDDRLVEVTMLVGYYSMLSMQLTVFRVTPRHD